MDYSIISILALILNLMALSQHMVDFATSSIKLEPQHTKMISVR